MTDTKDLEKKHMENMRLIEHATLIRKLALSDYIHGYINDTEKDARMSEAEQLLDEVFQRRLS